MILIMLVGSSSVENTRLNNTVDAMKKIMVEQKIAHYTSDGKFEYLKDDWQ